jgi:multicomponent Na+:H+ antiporter subunit E
MDRSLRHPGGSHRRLAAPASGRNAARLVLLAALWAALNPRDPGSWIVGVPVIAAAAWAAARLAPPAAWRFTPAGIARFVPFFLLASLRGGVDVAWRAVHPRLPIDPALVRHALGLPEGTARVFLIDAMSLLPGTLSANCEGSTLVVHVLNDAQAAAAAIVELEERVAALFGVALAGEGRSRTG